MQMMPSCKCAEVWGRIFLTLTRFSLRQEAELFHCWINPTLLHEVAKVIATQGFDLNF